MALKRLDEEFELKPGTQLLPYMKRLLPSLEGRFQDLEETATIYASVMEDIRASALARMNEILIPATEDIVEVTKLGFLLAPISTPYKFVLGYMGVTVDEGVQRDTFTPSPYLIVEHTPNDYCIARLIGYDQETGFLEMTVTAVHGNMGPWSDWMVSSTPGMADSTKLYHDEVGPWRDEVAADTVEVRQLHAEVLAAAQALAESGLDVYAFIRRDGTVPFIATQTAVAPVAGSNDATIPTTAWTRSRIQEYTANAVSRSGDTMAGPLTLSGPPSQPLHASTKAYVDAVLGQGGTMNANLTIQATNPSLRLYPTSTNQNRMIEALASDGKQRWVLVLADSAPMTGTGGGVNFTLNRYSDAGALIDSPLTIARETGLMTVKSLTYGGVLSGVGDINAVGDISIYRSGAPTTGAFYLNQAKSAYLYFNGTKHVLAGGGLDVAGPAAINGTLGCLGAFTTNGYLATTWGLTCHGVATINSTLVVNGQQNWYGAGSNYLLLHDSDWGPMYLHHNQDIIGFLNHGGQWIQYTNINGHIWSPAYGWMHDYINNTAYNQAWNAANYRYNQLVSTMRFAYLTDVQHYFNGLQEPWNGGVITGMTGCYANYWVMGRYRQAQIMIAGGWYVAGYA
jgi:hypothetical protein